MSDYLGKSSTFGQLIKNVPTEDAPVTQKFETKDSGKRAKLSGGMVRDTQEGKPRFDLLLPKNVPYEEQFLTRLAGLMARGAEKYEDRNWERANDVDALDRFKASAFRHLMQWLNDEVDEDHAAAVAFNLMGYESTKYKITRQEYESLEF